MPQPRPEPPLSEWIRAFLDEARRAVLTTIDARDGRPRSVPICFAISGSALVSALDEKPKSTADPRLLRRVRNLAADPRATILVDRWDEDWTRLAFVELACRGELMGPEHADHRAAVTALRARYPQYAAHRLEDRPLLRFAVDAATSWAAARAPEARGPEREPRRATSRENDGRADAGADRGADRPANR